MWSGAIGFERDTQYYSVEQDYIYGIYMHIRWKSEPDWWDTIFFREFDWRWIKDTTVTAGNFKFIHFYSYHLIGGQIHYDTGWRGFGTDVLMKHILPRSWNDS